jgi:hypothetical protein
MNGPAPSVRWGMGSSTMTAGGGASCATAGSMIQPAATRSVARATSSGEHRQLAVNFIRFIIVTRTLLLPSVRPVSGTPPMIVVRWRRGDLFDGKQHFIYLQHHRPSVGWCVRTSSCVCFVSIPVPGRIGINDRINGGLFYSAGVGAFALCAFSYMFVIHAALVSRKMNPGHFLSI